MKTIREFLAVMMALLVATPVGLFGANHREAPITALDHKADITDVYAFVSYGPDQAPNTPPSKVTFIMCVDPLLEPANGPNYFPFDPEILYEIKVDNDNDAKEDVLFQFRFSTEQRLPGLFQVYAGILGGAVAPSNSPAPVPPGTPIVPDKIDSFDDDGLGMRQSYTLTMLRKHPYPTSAELKNSDGAPFYVVPANVGSRTIDYPMLFEKGTYSLSNGISVFAGTTDDGFWIDLGATFDTLNLRTLGSGIPAVLTDTEDMAKANFASDTVSGYAVNSIAIEVPIAMLTRTGQLEPADSPAATIGFWATTSRPQVTIRRSPEPSVSAGRWRQVQRMGNPLFNELIIGTGSKDRFSMDQPVNDGQFASFALDPLLARVVNALTGGVVAIPTPPRTDLLPLVTYAPPIAADGTPAGPVADLLRLNTGVPATPPADINRLGLLGGDPAGFPNGRRLQDDVTDIALRVVVGGVLVPGFDTFPNNRLGDGVNVNDASYRDSFPYLADGPDGRNRRHIDPGEPGGGPVD
jgi:hypothetical protein